ncbi:MAG: hypothetical protein FRX48_03193 [Lasallia pustulata]|uniref:Uncharacterized protein n=1 Tax=Lasallia pustulata TaxID=136370 RepID=A0A5M8PWV5_9LECA|nr:MAG: hypothetical protein FRX48_03193 [Lasallia pustulata]
MAARPNPDEYNLPAKWVPVSGELARGRRLASLSETERAIFYNQDVLYHQNLEILQMLDKLKAQNSDASSNSSSRRDLTSAAPEEVEGVQKPLVEMPAPPVPSVRLPPVNKEEPQSPSTTATVPPASSLSIPLTSFLDSRSPAVTGPTPFALARTSSLSGSAPMPSTLQTPQGLPQTVNVPSWQEKFNDLFGTRNEQGKRKADISNSEEDKDHYTASTRFREEFSKSQRLEELPKSKDDSAEPSIGFRFSTIGGNNNARIAGTTNLAPSSPVGFHASASKPEGNAFGTRSLFSSSSSTASACQGTGSTPFEAYLEKESAGPSTWYHYQSINLSLAYRIFSFEELRLADYTYGRKFGASTTPAVFGQTSFGAAPTFVDSAQRSPASFGSINRPTPDGSLFANATTASSPIRAAANFFGGTPASQPILQWGIPGSGWASKSTTSNIPSEVGKFSIATAAAGLQTQAQGQNLGFGSQSKEPLKPTTTIFSLSKPSSVTPAAPNPAALPPMGTPGHEPEPTMNLFSNSKPWPVTPAAPNLAAHLPLKTPSLEPKPRMNLFSVSKSSSMTPAAPNPAAPPSLKTPGTELEPTGNLFSMSKPWPVTPAAPNLAAHLPLNTPSLEPKPRMNLFSVSKSSSMTPAAPNPAAPPSLKTPGIELEPTGNFSISKPSSVTPAAPNLAAPPSLKAHGNGPDTVKREAPKTFSGIAQFTALTRSPPEKLLGGS